MQLKIESFYANLEQIDSFHLLQLVHHPLDVLGAESVIVIGDGDLLLVSGSLILGGDNHDTVGVNLEGNLDLWNASWCWWDAGNVELSKKMVIFGHGSLSFVDLDGDGVLVVGSGGEDLALLGGNDGVPWDELGHDTTNGFNSKSKRVNVKKDNVSGVLFPRENTSLDSSSIGNSFIGIDSLAWLLSVKELLDELLDLGNSGGSSNQDNLVNFLLAKIRILQNLLDWLESSLEKIHVEFLEFGSGECLGKVLSLEKRFNLNSDLVGSRKSSLGLLGFSSELLDSTGVFTEILSFLLLVQLDEVLHHSLVKVLSSKMGISVGGHDLKDSIVNGQEGDIKGTASKIEDKDVLLTILLVHTIGNSSSSWLVDDSHDGHAGNDSSVLGGLPLGVIEVGCLNPKE